MMGYLFDPVLFEEWVFYGVDEVHHDVVEDDDSEETQFN